MSSPKELVEYIKSDEFSFKEVSLNYLKKGSIIPVFILYPNSFSNFTNIDLRKLINKQFSQNEIQLINQAPIKLNITFDEIISLKNNNIDFYIVNGLFLSRIGIKIGNPSLNLIYYEENNKKFLFFINESKLLMLEKTNINNINEEININSNNLIIELEEEKNKNKKLTDELNNEKIKTQNLLNKIQTLENSLNQNNTQINELNVLINGKNKEINDLKQKLNINLNNSLRNVGPNENIFAINFSTVDQKFHYCIPCKNSDIFVKCEEKLYNEFPEYKEYDNVYFMANGKTIKRFKTLEENNIKSGDNIILNIF